MPEDEKELAALKEEDASMRAQWENEKKAISEVKGTKQQIEEVKHQMEEAERNYDLEKLAQLKYGTLPELEKKLRDEAFEKSKNEKGEYQCACCGRTGTSRVAFQVDHIVPMNAGGKTVPENLQILCRQCNGEKSDRL